MRRDSSLRKNIRSAERGSLGMTGVDALPGACGSRTGADFSAILVDVRGKRFAFFFILIAPAALLSSLASVRQATSPPASSAPKTPVQQQPPAALPAAPQVSPLPPQPARQSLSVVVLDPGHGGPDAGARGPNGVLESEVVLTFARAIRAELEREGVRVLMTRQGSENPSFDDRSAVANGQRGAIFISLHVSSGGATGTARAYSLPLAEFQGSSVSANAGGGGLVNWDKAQQGYLGQSRRLAELVCIQLAEKFRGSPEVPLYGAVRQLRTVAAPAIAIEVASVSVPNAVPLAQMAPALAQAVARAVADFRPLYEAGVK